MQLRDEERQTSQGLFLGSQDPESRVHASSRPTGRRGPEGLHTLTNATEKHQRNLRPICIHIHRCYTCIYIYIYIYIMYLPSPYAARGQSTYRQTYRI